jgi:phage baseplate assembly protein V
MTQNLVDLLSPYAEASGRLYGVVTGVVTNTKDDEGLGRVRVRFPWLSGEEESWWARVAAPMAGPQRGAYFPPEVDDEVLVAFEHGDPRFPYVIGALWNGNHAPPESNKDGKNNKRTIRSRSGHVIRLDDTEGQEKIEIVDKAQKNSIVISTKDNTITIAADADITIKSMGGNLTVSGKKIEIKAEAGLSLQGASVEVKASGQVKINGSAVDIN